MALDFNSDIAPYSKVTSGTGDYFPTEQAYQGMPVGGMRASDYRRMQVNYAQNIAPLEDRAINMQNNIMRMRSQDLAYNRAQIAWEKEKQDQELRKQYNDPEALDKIGEILETDKSPLEQRNDILEIGRRNPQLLTHNPTFASAYQTGLQQTETKAKIVDKADAPHKSLRNTVANSLVQSKTPEGLDAGTRLLTGEISVEEGKDVLKMIHDDERRISRNKITAGVRKERLGRTIAALKAPREVDIKDTKGYTDADPDDKRELEAQFAERGGKRFRESYKLRLARDLIYYTDGVLPNGGTITVEEAKALSDYDLYALVDLVVRQQETIQQEGTLNTGDTVTTALEVEQGEAWNQDVIPQTTR